jgi:hypothetical protein
VALAAALAAGAWSFRDDLAYARIATGYAAKQTCSCRFVSERTLASCVADFPEDARERIELSERAGRIRASVLFGAIKAEAVYEHEFGCRLAS